MFKLVILAIHDPLANMEDKVFEIDTDFADSSGAELRAMRWLLYRPNDIIMLQEIQTSTCVHCDTPIEEKVGWVRHRWIHIGGHYACLPAGETQATPREEVPL